MPRQVHTVRISYGIFNNPNHKKIEKTIEKWMSKGYVLQTRQDHPCGCLASLLTMGWARGKTELTFISRELYQR